MALAVAAFVADGKIFSMAVAAFAQCLNVLQRGGIRADMLAAHPAGHYAMQLSGDGFVHLDAEVLQTARPAILLYRHAQWRGAIFMPLGNQLSLIQTDLNRFKRGRKRILNRSLFTNETCSHRRITGMHVPYLTNALWCQHRCRRAAGDNPPALKRDALVKFVESL